MGPLIDKGHHDVTCRECGAQGHIVLGTQHGKKVRVRDFVEHKESCSHYVRPQPTHLRKKRWRSQEREANALVGARATLASGAVGEDGDGRLFNEWRVESKQTEKLAYTIPQRVWAKLVSGALGAGEEPLLHVLIDSGNAKQRIVVLRAEMYQGWSENGSLPRYSITRRLAVGIGFQMPVFIPDLDPPAVAMYEHVFTELKDKWTNSETSSTPPSGRSSGPGGSRS